LIYEKMRSNIGGGGAAGFDRHGVGTEPQLRQLRGTEEFGVIAAQAAGSWTIPPSVPAES
jgi:hypothetical protein